MKKQDKEEIIKIVIAIGIIIVVIFIGNLLFPSNNENKFETDFEKNIEATKETKIFTISGSNNIETINNKEYIINLVITGLNSQITISKETEISRITISGNNHKINLCKEIHNPEIIKSGSNIQISYKNC